MFNTYRNEYETRRGRRVQPTTKVRLHLAEVVAGELRELSSELQAQQDVVSRAIDTGETNRRVSASHRIWSDLCHEFDTLEVEYQEYLQDEELRIHFKLVDEKQRDFQDFNEYVLSYLRRDGCPPPVTSDREGVRAEAQRLEHEMLKIEDRLSRASIKLRKDYTRSPSLESCRSLPSSHRSSPRAPAMPNFQSTPLNRSYAEVPEVEDVVTRRHPLGRATTARARSRDVPRRGEEEAAPDSVTQALTRLASMLNSSSQRLPDMEPDKFTGDLLAFPFWLKSFEALIERKTTSVTDRLFYLGKYTGGDAHECVSGFLSLYLADAYQRAKSLLVSRFGDKLKVAEAYKKKLLTWTQIKRGDSKALRKFADFLWQCHAAMESIFHLRSLSSAEEMVKIVRTLPTHMAERWDRIVDGWYYRGASNPSDYMLDYQGEYPPFQELCSFVAKEARIADGPGKYLGADGSATASSEPPKSAKKSHTFASTSQSDDAQAGGGQKKMSCYFCSGEHVVSKCGDFLALPASERKDFAQKNRLCFGCMSKFHNYKRCRHKNPALLKDGDVATKKSSAVSHRVQTNRTDENTVFYSLVLPVELCHPDNPDIVVRTYAMLDTQSDSCFLSDKLLNALDPPRQAVDLELHTMGSSTCVRSEIVRDLVVKGVGEARELTIRRAYTRAEIPANRESIPRRDELAKNPHLAEMTEKMAPYEPELEVGLLIGYNCPLALITRALLHDGDDRPCGVYTSLGWSALGGARSSTDSVVRCLRTTAVERPVRIAEVVAAFDLDFSHNDDPETMKTSQSDKLFMEKMTASIHQLPDGHYEMDLPFKSEPTIMPDNRDVAFKRLMGLKSKMQRDPEYCSQYQAFMQALIEDGHAELAPADGEPGKVNFLSHHGVKHPRKPGKVRGVFDGSAIKDGVSLNSQLLSGPDLTNNLVGVLCRFREERVAFTCDIKGMFLQVRVSPRHRDYLRFLWFEGGDPGGRILEYCMLVHLFGATSSPSCSSLALKTAANDQEEKFGLEAAEFVRRGFYVDDGLHSKAEVDEAVRLFMNAHNICQGGGFWLHKFVSSSPEAIAKVPPELRAESLREFEVNKRILPTETSLGIRWEMARDCFIFVIRELCRGRSRREMLSALSSIYDPLGLLAPVILVGRIVLQQLCRTSIAWDELVPDEFAQRWGRWYEDLQELIGYGIPRCLRRATQGRLSGVQLHLFCDASTQGYGTCAYVRLQDEGGTVDVSLVAAKARVTPKKAVTIPRLELQSAVLAIKLAEFLRKELTYESMSITYWTDSTVSLGYICNEEKRFHLYVTNRVSFIRQNSERSQWHHVAGEENPADLASRGCSVAELKEEMWWHGPKFLREKSQFEGEETYEVDERDPEVKQRAVTVLSTRVKSKLSIIRRLESCKDWWTMRKTVAVWRRYLGCLKTRYKTAVKQPMVPGERKLYLSCGEIQDATVTILRLVQEERYEQEYTLLQIQKSCREDGVVHHSEPRSISRASRLYGLQAYIDSDEVIRVGGRLRRSKLPEALMNPVILPDKHAVTNIIVLHHHEKLQHPGKQTTLSAVRSAGYWPVHGRSEVARVINKCVVCRRIRGKPVVQLMADLPEDRLEEGPPFSNCGADLFGPFLVKDGRVERKRWVCLFTCPSSRAVHIEPVHSLSTDSFLAAFRRFTSRRGPIRTLRSDCGTNFVGAQSELMKAMSETDKLKVHQELLKAGCDGTKFLFNPPRASHMGGVWERLIRTVRSVLSRMLDQNQRHLSDEVFTTLLTEAEAIVNSRPLATLDLSDPLADPPLTPGRLLTGKTSTYQPLPGDFVTADLYSRKHWRRAQYLAEEFWRQWRREFVSTMQQRRKWNERRENLAVGDVMLLMDEELPRGSWPLAVVKKVMPSADNLIRKVEVRSVHGSYVRPICKLVYLCSSE